MQRDRLIGAEHFAGSDAEEERVADLPGSSGDSDFNRRLHTDFLATDLHQPSSETTAWQADETQIFSMWQVRWIVRCALDVDLAAKAHYSEHRARDCSIHLSSARLFQRLPN